MLWLSPMDSIYHLMAAPEVLIGASKTYGIASIAQGFGNTMRVRSYLNRATSDGEGAPLDKSGLMDLCVKGELAWQICEFCTFSGYVAYSDFVFDRRIREAARIYERTGDWDHSWNFIAGLSVTLSF